MELSDLISPERVKSNMDASSKKNLLQTLSTVLAKSANIPESEVFAAIMDREKLGSTGVGQGVAIPHARIKGIDKIIGCFVHLQNAIDFESIDEEHVDLVFMMIAPQDAGAEHLKALARISRLLRNKATCEKLRKTADDHILYELIAGMRSVAA